MLKEIILKNFKNIKMATIEPAILTVFIGPNGSGKSSVLQSLVLVKQSKDSGQLNVQGEILQLGTMKDIIRKGSELLEIELKGVFTPDLYEIKRLKIDISESELEKIYYEFKIEATERQINLLKLNLKPESPLFQNLIIEGLWNAYEGEHDEQKTYEGNLLSIKISPRIGNIFGFSYRGREREIWDKARFLQFLSASFDRQLNEIYYVPASRGFTRPYYGIEDRASKFFSSSSLDRQSQQVATTLGIQRNYEEIVSNWMKKVTGVKIRPNLGESKQIGIGSTKEDLELNISIINEGFGTNQLVQLFLTLAIADKGSTILIEEPEIHLHPKAQSELANLLTDISLNENKQLMITTHSEHILFKILSLIKRGILTTNDVTIYHFEDKEGIANIEKLDINENGQIKGGLKSFFDAEIEEFGSFFKEV